MSEDRKIYSHEPPARWNPLDFEKLLLWAVRERTSDIKLVPGNPVWARIHGRWQGVSTRALSTGEIAEILDHLSRNRAAVAAVKGGKDIDFGAEVAEDRLRKHRFRGNATGCRDGWSAGIEITLRTIPDLPPPIDALQLEPALMEAAFPHNGLVLVTGTMGSGKSTLLAAILRHIGETQPRAISTFEAPIEFDLALKSASGPITQSEIPTHFEAFVRAARNAARRASDVILVGESRDKETLATMIEAAEIGPAVYSTVHTRSVAATPARIINVFGADEQNQIKAMLLSSLRLIVQQRLEPAFDPATGLPAGRVALREFLKFDSDIREELLLTPFMELGPAIQRLVEERGQSLLVDARRKFEEGRISGESVAKIQQEFERRKAMIAPLERTDGMQEGMTNVA